jgi:hypothetical protein
VSSEQDSAHPIRRPIRDDGGVARTRTAVLLSVAAAATLAVYVISTFVVTTRDRDTKLDEKGLRETAKTACRAMTGGLDDLPSLPDGATLAQRQERMAAQTALARQLVVTVERTPAATLDDDVPAREWLKDWTAFADARDAYAAGGLVGELRFAVPVDQGEPITRRMSDIGLDSCVVPRDLLVAP